LKVLNGAPTYFYYFSNFKGKLDEVWSLISDAISKSYIVGVDTGASNNYGLVNNHAYTVLGQYPLKDPKGNVVVRLYRVRNPYSADVYTGAWKDDDSKWTDAYRK
jgi:hypothetical protein